MWMCWSSVAVVGAVPTTAVLAEEEHFALAHRSFLRREPIRLRSERAEPLRQTVQVLLDSFPLLAP